MEQGLNSRAGIAAIQNPRYAFVHS